MTVSSPHPSAFWAETQKLVALGGPLAGAQLLTLGIQTSDVVMLGWYGVEALAATVLATQVYFFVMLGLFGFAFAVSPLVAEAHGKEDSTAVRQLVRAGLWVVLITGFGGLAVLACLEPILVALRQDPDLIALAVSYNRIAMWGLLPVLWLTVLRSFFSALEITGVILASTVGGLLLNIGVNYVLIFGNFGAPELGIEGAAIASIATASFITIWMMLVAALSQKTRQFVLFQRFWNIDWSLFGRVFRLGGPIGLSLLAEAGLFTMSSFLMGWLGALALAVHGIVLQIASITFMIPLGISQATTVRIGNALGRGDTARAQLSARASLLLAMILGLCTMTLFFTMPETLLSLFTDHASSERAAIIGFGAVLLFWAGLFQLVDFGQVTTMGILRGHQDTTIPMAIAVICYWLIGLPASYLLAFTFNFGGAGIWMGLTVGLTAAALALGMRYRLILVRISEGT